MATKCAVCNKIVNKKSPGLECNKCGVFAHAKTECAGLTNKQLNALRATENLEWTCNDCKDTSLRKISITGLGNEEDDDDEISHEISVDTKKFMALITKEMNKILKREISETNTSMQFVSDKVDECLEKMDVFQEKIKDLENKNKELTNKNKHLEIKINAMEQRMEEMEQNQLKKYVELVGVPQKVDEDLREISKKIASKLNLPEADICKLRRILSRANTEGTIRLEMRDEDICSKWLQASRSIPIYGKDISSNIDPKLNLTKIYLREVLTSFNKTLLWKAKQNLKEYFKFVWFKNGKIYARKEEKSKINIIRSESDIMDLKREAKIE